MSLFYWLASIAGAVLALCFIVAFGESATVRESPPLRFLVDLVIFAAYLIFMACILAVPVLFVLGVVWLVNH